MEDCLWFTGGLRHLKACLQVIESVSVVWHHLNWELLAVSHQHQGFWVDFGLGVSEVFVVRSD